MKESKTLFDSNARTASENGSAVEFSARSIAFYLSCTAASGTTPTLDVTIEEWDPVSGTWWTVVTFTQLTTTGTERKTLTDVAAERFRAVATIAGTSPSFTFSVGANYDAR